MSKIYTEPKDEEHMQILLVNWLRRHFHESVYNALHHSPNGGKRSKSEAGRFKLMGTKAGFPDLVIFLRTDYNAVGLAIELKMPKEKPRKNQVDWLGILRMADFAAVWRDNLREAKMTILESYSSKLLDPESDPLEKI